MSSDNGNHSVGNLTIGLDMKWAGKPIAERIEEMKRLIQEMDAATDRMNAACDRLQSITVAAASPDAVCTVTAMKPKPDPDRVPKVTCLGTYRRRAV